MRILLLDIETAPNLAYVWGLWNQNVGTNMLIEGGYILSWAAKWYGSEEVFYMDRRNKKMIKEIHKLITEADAVIHYNGTKFDMPHLNREFILAGLAPPAPYKQIDLLKTCRSQFKFPSNKLEYVVKALKIGIKGDTGGFETWVGCMNNDPESWAIMQQYNVQDVLLLERLYERLRPWIKGHANASIYRGVSDEGRQGPSCPTCAGVDYQRRGWAYTTTYRYPRFQCKECKSWFRGPKSEGPKERFIAV